MSERATETVVVDDANTAHPTVPQRAGKFDRIAALLAGGDR